ncbi:hypothetical protein A0J61_10945 [Choanephora cucurbitarum]|uniref:Endonuclease/exonuclease/phosphatase domain-containing protein n=1 Tax=Choanephora cucurbitarum TaxID=101091 RepID=A0A1C7MX29_9FUNG|nr:hypothetical protein A0J61_10945 [Choanephora cucurbitarum]
MTDRTFCGHPLVSPWMDWLQARYPNCFPDGLPTFTSSANSSIRTTIDYVYVLPSESVKIRNQQIHHLPSSWTDHSLLSFDLALDNVNIGPGSWRFNPLLLQDKRFCRPLDQSVVTFFESMDLPRLSITPPAPHLPNETETLRPPPTSGEIGLRREIWECLKRLLRQVAQTATRLSSSRAKHSASRLQQQRLELLRQLSTASDITIQNGLQHQLTQLNFQIEQLLEKETAQYRLRTATRWHETGERNSKYFFRTLKARHNLQTIHGLRDSSTG